MKYEDLEQHFTAPKVISGMFSSKRIPRKLKKKVKAFCYVHWEDLTNGQRLWYYLGNSNKSYKAFLIKQLCNNCN